MKTKKAAAKRFKRTGSGKIKHRKAWRGHNRNKKSAARWRRNKGTGTLSGKDAKNVDRLLN
jgi:large subunit ribosomal protein L35